ncbi:MAG TPA: YihY/virulence factor BrkB family protein [Flavipsychrobacter sp.]|nr:YihY/virulence factor BrkB family protein [Flavipsychrobacter sp.]
MPRLKEILYKIPLLRPLLSWADKVQFPGANGLSLGHVADFFFEQIANTKLNERSAAATFSFLMALPPSLLFLFSLVPYLPLKDVQSTINYAIIIITPNSAIQQSALHIIDDFLNNERKDLLSFGIILTIFFSSNGMMGLMQSFDRSHEVYKERTGLKRRWTAIKLTLLLMLVAVISLAALIIQSNALNSLILMVYDNVILVKLFSIFILVCIVFFSISIIYRYGPSLRDPIAFFSPGSILATFLFILSTAIFFFLVNNFLNYNKIYGPIGTMIAFMVWLRITTLILLLGYELNVSILLGKSTMKK